MRDEASLLLTVASTLRLRVGVWAVRVRGSSTNTHIKSSKTQSKGDWLLFNGFFARHFCSFPGGLRTRCGGPSGRGAYSFWAPRPCTSRPRQQ